MLQPLQPSADKTAITMSRQLIPIGLIERRIYLIRGQKVMLSTHLAELYEVEPRVLVQTVKRNCDRFPEDFMFQLSAAEFEILKSQFVISRWGGLRRAAPYAFTEQGVAMLSSVLKSKRAVQVNIAIMHAFVRLREIIASHGDLELSATLPRSQRIITARKLGGRGSSLWVSEGHAFRPCPVICCRMIS
jgi:hypothetical protein